MTSSRRSAVTVLAAVALLAGHGRAMTQDAASPQSAEPAAPSVPGFTVEILERMPELPGGLGPLPPVPVPPENPQTLGKVELGRMLFFERSLSVDFEQSCASCHDPAHGFADGRPLAVGFKGKLLGRHTPTVLNAAYNTTQFWDGRVATLEQQAELPIVTATEMNLASEDELVRRLESTPLYRESFARVFGARPSLKTVAQAIAAFERTLVTTDSAFDRYAQGDRAALSEDQKRGLALFVGKAACVQCHRGPNFTDNAFHSIGLRGSAGDPGRSRVTGAAEHRESFKTPSLRDVAITPPYMHDGSLATLADVIDFYDRGGDRSAHRSEFVFELDLTAPEKIQLLRFLEALSSEKPMGSSASGKP